MSTSPFASDPAAPRDTHVALQRGDAAAAEALAIRCGDAIAIANPCREASLRGIGPESVGARRALPLRKHRARQVPLFDMARFTRSLEAAIAANVGRSG